tara:strand:+ start:547 stop:1278 length:732 start_codon:yes stop_codon:yes gene_type:complete
MKSEKELKEIYEKYIDINLFHVFPKRSLKKILKEGIDPKEDPYEKIKPKIKQLAKIISGLEKKGFIVKVKWGREIPASYVMSVTLNDLKITAVDFAPTLKDVEYYLRLKGGALISNILRITNVMVEERYPLTKSQLKLVNDLNNWTKSMVCDNAVISISGSCSCFESAKFQLINRGKRRRKKYREPDYYQSPFGSFEHFKKVIRKEGWRKYSSRLKNKKFYLRVNDRIPAKEIKGLKQLEKFK